MPSSSEMQHHLPSFAVSIPKPANRRSFASAGTGAFSRETHLVESGLRAMQIASGIILHGAVLVCVSNIRFKRKKTVRTCRC